MIIMIKKIFILFFLTLYSAEMTAEERYIEGKHYIATETGVNSDSIEEVFSYFCVHCFRFQPALTRLQARLSDRTVIEKTYISHVSSEAAPINSHLAKIRLLAIKHNSVEQLDKIFFNAFHVDKKDLSSEESLNKLLIDSGLNSLVSEAALQEKEISDLFLKLKERNLNLVGNKTIVSLPTLIVKGKYRVNLSSLDSKNLDDDLYGLINHLMNK